ncbi:DYW domain [Dillenia turbinata]|uniref:DYW domain n=1 Tax=Dillenia turbinata TaxID=194707 RepID=A0AAN8ZEK9_9MAGN
MEKFKETIRSGLQLTQITFVSFLNACTHGGLFDLAFKMLNAMTIEYGVEPQMEYYGCVVDLLGGLGRDFRHPKGEDIYRKPDEINQMLRSKGYSAATEVALQDIGDPEMEWSLAIHRERLAICYGLISTELGTILRVVTNSRVCHDCHSMIKLVAKVNPWKNCGERSEWVPSF